MQLGIPTPPGDQPLRVLVVDDDAEILEIIRERLQMEGFLVEGTTSPGQALLWFLSRPFAVFMLDIQMQGINGLSLLQLARLSSQETAVVMISGAGNLKQAVTSLRLGADDYICKPFKIWDLRDRVRSALSRRRTIQQRTQGVEDGNRGAEESGEHSSSLELVQRLRTLAIAVERSVAQDAGHIDRVVQLVEFLGGELSLSVEERRHLQLAAELRDLGHVHLEAEEPRPVPATVANASVRYREHPAISATCVDALGAEFGQVAKTILHHHECWSGLGFPRGLAGEKIPRLARVLKLADDFARLVGIEAMGLGKQPRALKQLMNHGEHYDPELLALLGTSVTSGQLLLNP
jgi:putative two-component system response regulator